MDIKDLSAKLNLKRSDKSVGASLAYGCEFWDFIDYPDAWISNYDVEKDESTIDDNTLLLVMLKRDDQKRKLVRKVVISTIIGIENICLFVEIELNEFYANR